MRETILKQSHACLYIPHQTNYIQNVFYIINLIHLALKDGAHHPFESLSDFFY
jgi:hypothetical protein